MQVVEKLFSVDPLFTNRGGRDSSETTVDPDPQDGAQADHNRMPSLADVKQDEGNCLAGNLNF